MGPNGILSGDAMLILAYNTLKYQPKIFETKLAKLLAKTAFRFVKVGNGMI
jgi:hypothetical protein